MQLDIYVVDAFTSVQFKGNPAAVVVLDDWLSNETMLNIAAENNLSETAFIKLIASHQYEIRWFSPITEIDFCGHATLASAYVLFNELGLTGSIEFITRKVGSLNVVLNGKDEIEMSFPKQEPVEVLDIPTQLIEGLSSKPVQVLKSRQAYFAIYDNEQDVIKATYNAAMLKQLAPYDVVISSISSQYDFVSRYFWPANGGEEDPVTGSIHAGLAPYWAKKLSKSELIAYQASKRGGVINCLVKDNIVVISGNGVLYLKGTIKV